MSEAGPLFCRTKKCCGGGDIISSVQLGYGPSKGLASQERSSHSVAVFVVVVVVILLIYTTTSSLLPGRESAIAITIITPGLLILVSLCYD